MSKLDHLLPKIVPLLRLMLNTASSDGEIVNSAKALVRMLGNDVEEIFTRVAEQPFGDADMRELYEGVRKQVLADLTLPPNPNLSTADGVNGYEWATIVEFCMRSLRRLSQWEQNFIKDMSIEIGENELSQRQYDTIRKIFTSRFGGKIA